MVKDTRKTAGTGDIRPLNRPSDLAVKAGSDGLPVALKLRGRWLEVESVADRWRIDDEWWRSSPVSRVYYQLVCEGGIRMTLFQDLLTGSWFCQQE